MLTILLRHKVVNVRHRSTISLTYGQSILVRKFLCTSVQRQAHLPQLSPYDVNLILRENEFMYTFTEEQSCSVHGYESNQLGSNRPCEDTRTEATFIHKNAFICGIFDGHGGPACSQVVSKRLLRYVAASVIDRKNKSNKNANFVKEMKDLYEESFSKFTETGQWLSKKLTVEHNTDNQCEVKRIIPKKNAILPYVTIHYYTPPYLTAEPEVEHHKLTPNDKFLVIASDELWDFLTASQGVGLVGEHLSSKRILEPVKIPPGDVSLQSIADLLAQRKAGLTTKPLDQNSATHLIRYALVSTDYDIEHSKISYYLSLPQDVVRLYRDDMTITVIYFNSDCIFSLKDAGTS
uniref:PPM-type phosphatase domain-containing protein n=1 Tax=Glossina austeni TaxID=7395 RepID=A0A1A9UMP7_GLOAU